MDKNFKLNFRAFTLCLAAPVLLLLVSGCSTPTMKGTPFYSGDSPKHQGPAEQRLNAWPLCYYRDPSLSVLWPVFESTDDHVAVRPIFSVYGLEKTNSQRKYNILWPIAQFDRKTHNSHILPFFWNTGSSNRNYFVTFPIYWHSGHPLGTNGSDSLFPLWILDRTTNRFDLFAPWPIVNYWTNQSKQQVGSMVLPLYHYNHDKEGKRFLSLPWMQGRTSDSNSWRTCPVLFYQSSTLTNSTLVTPLWAQGHSLSNHWQAIVPFGYWNREDRTLVSPLWAQWRNEEKKTYLAPWTLSWATDLPERTDLWLFGGMAHASWGEKPNAHHVFPLYYRDHAQGTFLTPIFGWSSNHYVYPLTPLAGVRVGETKGSWLYPVFSHSKSTNDGTIDNRYLLMAGHQKSKTRSCSWIFPLFFYEDKGAIDTIPSENVNYATYGKRFFCLPFCWYVEQSRIRPLKAEYMNSYSPSLEVPLPEVSQTTNTFVRNYVYKNGIFPLWSYSQRLIAPTGAKTTKQSILLCYDYKHELTPVTKVGTKSTNDYTRRRLLWRLYHYERLNGDVSLDVFPTFTYDHKVDGYKKVSFLFRLFRYERTKEGAKKADILFLPVLRTQ